MNSGVSCAICKRKSVSARRYVGVLKLSNLLQLDRFQKDLNITRVRLHAPCASADRRRNSRIASCEIHFPRRPVHSATLLKPTVNAQFLSFKPSCSNSSANTERLLFRSRTWSVGLKNCNDPTFEMARPETIVSGLFKFYLRSFPIWQRVRRLPAAANQPRSVNDHRHRVRLSWITFALRLKNEPDCILARPGRTKAKHLYHLFTVRNTVPWSFETTPKELYTLSEWRYSPEIPGSGIRLKAHRKFPTDGYHDGFEFHAIAFLSGGDGLDSPTDSPFSSILTPVA